MKFFFKSTNKCFCIFVTEQSTDISDRFFCVGKQMLELAKIAGEEDIEAYEKELELITAYARNVLFKPEKNLFATAWDEYNIASQVWIPTGKHLIRISRIILRMDRRSSTAIAMHGAVRRYIF